MQAAHVAVGPEPFHTICPKCKKQVETKTNRKAGWKAWTGCGVLCLLGCWLGCCLIPFCIDPLNTIEHRCPECNSYIGRYE